jgi:hypothetical protein
MEIQTMGRPTVAVVIENNGDVWNSSLGNLPVDQVRKVEVSDALIDKGASLVSLPTTMIQQLGLQFVISKGFRSSAGVGEARLFSAVRLTIQGRSCTMDVMEVPDGIPVLIGQLPIEHLDFVIDLRNGLLIGNPAHGGEHMYELY